jgi:hypothetical protein
MGIRKTISEGDSTMKAAISSLILFVVGLFIISVQIHAVEEGLVGYWKLDEDEGEQVQDSSGMGNNGVIIGNVEWVEGMFGSALLFSEPQSCVNIEHSESIDLSEEFTIALWTKPEENQPASAKFLCKQKSGEYPYSLQYNDTGSGIFGTINTTSRFDTAPHLEVFTEWAHLAYTYNGEAGILYKDGVEVARKDASGELQHNELSLTIGSRLESSQSFKGIIDDVRLYNIALTPDEISVIMEGPRDLPVNPDGSLVSTWGAIKK